MSDHEHPTPYDWAENGDFTRELSLNETQIEDALEFYGSLPPSFEVNAVQLAGIDQKAQEVRMHLSEEYGIDLTDPQTWYAFLQGFEAHERFLDFSFTHFTDEEGEEHHYRLTDEYFRVCSEARLAMEALTPKNISDIIKP